MNKICTKCNIEKPIDEFAFKNKSKGKRASRCKTCHREYEQDYYIKNKSDYIRRAKSTRQRTYIRNREFIDSYKSNLGCKYCDEVDSACLDFHHISDDKEYTISQSLNSHSLEFLLREIDKCVVVCANCHRKIHAGKIK